MSTSESYILNRVQNPELLEIAYRSIKNGNRSKDGLENDTGMTTENDRSGTLDLALEGLLLLGFIQRSDYEYITEPFAFNTGIWKLDFQMTMLHNVAREADPDDWGKQSALVLTYEYLLSRTQFFPGTSQELINQIDRWHQKQGYEPRNKRGERQKLNPEKFSHWRNQAEYLGLIHPTKGRSSSYTVAPNPDLIAASVEAACQREGDGDGIETRSYVEWLGENLLRVPLTTEREFTKPISRTFYQLAKSDRLAFVKHGDQERIGLQGVPVSKNDQIAKDANYLRVKS